MTELNHKSSLLHLPVMLDEDLLEALPAAVYVCDLDGVVVRYNKRAAELWGRSPIPGDANELYCGAHRLYLANGELMPHNQTPMVDAMRSGTSFRNIEVQMEQPNGRRIWVLVSIDPLRSEHGQIVGAINCFQDITEHKLEQERKLLADELNHRIKNTLAVVDALAVQTLRNGADDRAIENFRNRVRALGGAHDILLRQSWQGASLKETIQSVVAPYGSSDTVRLVGPDLELSQHSVLKVSLLIHELSTNALKHGSLSKDGGHVKVAWDAPTSNGNREFVLEWVESGGPAVSAPTHRGFGSRLIEAGLGGRGTVRYDIDGLQASFRAPYALLFASK